MSGALGGEVAEDVSGLRNSQLEESWTRAGAFEVGIPRRPEDEAADLRRAAMACVAGVGTK